MTKPDSKGKYLLWLAPLLAILVYVVCRYAAGWEHAPSVTLAITTLTALWWISEVLPLWVTSLVPLVSLPVFGVLDQRTAGESLGQPVVLLMLGAFMLAAAMEHTSLHRQLAARILNLTGTGSSMRLIWGLMFTSILLSMWLSNTATLLMLLPLAMPILRSATDKRACIAGILALTYGANLGGMATPIGTPPNAVFASQYEALTGTYYGFAPWMSIAIPVILCITPLMGWWITRGIKGGVSVQLHQDGWTLAQKRVLIIFLFTALAWMTRTAPFGGWQSLLGLQGIHDATVALTATVFLFIVSDGQGSRLLTWEKARGIHWGVLLLFAGGLSLAKAFTVSGLSNIIGDALLGMGELPYGLAIGGLALSVSLLTEVTTNTATTTLLLPVLASVADSLGHAPEVWMLPVTLAASCAFMLPSATAPNAIAFSTGELRIIDMVKAGVFINLASVLIIGFWSWVFLSPSG